MIKTIAKTRNLPSFRIHLDDIPNIAQNLSFLFSEKHHGKWKLEFTQNENEFVFHDHEDIKTFKNLRSVPGKNVNLKFGDYPYKYISIGGDFMGSMEVSVSGGDSIWTEAALSATVEAIRPSRVWYWKLKRIPFTSIGALSAFLFFMILSKVAENAAATPPIPPNEVQKKIMVVTLGSALFSGVMVLTKNYFMPSSRLIIQDQGSWLEKYAPAIGLLIGFIGTVGTIVGLFK